MKEYSLLAKMKDLPNICRISVERTEIPFSGWQFRYENKIQHVIIVYSLQLLSWQLDETSKSVLRSKK